MDCARLLPVLDSDAWVAFARGGGAWCAHRAKGLGTPSIPTFQLGRLALEQGRGPSCMLSHTDLDLKAAARMICTPPLRDLRSSALLAGAALPLGHGGGFQQGPLRPA
eukprot:353281-Chlamydomonas_euryale.AAC.1